MVISCSSSINGKWGSLRREGDLSFSPLCLCLCCYRVTACRKKFLRHAPSRRQGKLCLFVFELAWHGVEWGDIFVMAQVVHQTRFVPQRGGATAPKCIMHQRLFMSEQSGPWFIKQQRAFPTLRWREETRWLHPGIFPSSQNVTCKGAQQCWRKWGTCPIILKVGSTTSIPPPPPALLLCTASVEVFQSLFYKAVKRQNEVPQRRDSLATKGVSEIFLWLLLLCIRWQVTTFCSRK